MSLLYEKDFDEIFLVLNDLKDLRAIMCHFEANSVLRFTFETETSENAKVRLFIAKV